MSAQRFFLPAAAGATAIGGYLYYNSASKPDKSRVEQRRERGDAKREAGLGGAGVGLNAVTGLHEKSGPGSGVPTANTDPDRAVKTDARKEELPSGGVGGGVGAGGANTRKTVDISAKKVPGESNGIFESGSSGSSEGQTTTANKTTSDGGNSGSNAGSSSTSSSSGSSSSSGNTGSAKGKSSWSQGLQGIFGQGGATAGDQDQVHKKYHDTKVHSNHADTPTKRFPGETVK